MDFVPMDIEGDNNDATVLPQTEDDPKIPFGDTDSIPAAETVRREIEIQLPKAIEQALEKDVPAALDRALHKATFDMPDPITGEPAEGEVAILPKQKKLMRLKAQLTALEGESARMKAAEQRLKFLNRPHDFDGTGHYVEWREKMDHFMTVLNMPSSEEVSVATSYLKGAALSWWNTEQKRMQDPPTDWCQLLMLLNARYDHLNPVLAARTKLETLKQGSMSLQQYLTEYENCYAHIPHSDEDDKIFRFTFHMRPDLQQRFAVNPLTQRRWDNWPALVTYLSAFLSDAACAEVPRHTQKGSNGAGSSGGGGNPGLKVKGGVQKHTKNPKSQKGAGGKNPASNFTKPMASGEVTRTWSEWGFCLSQNICYGCYQKGHTVDKCPGPVASGHPPKYTRDWAVDLPKEKQAKFRSFMRLSLTEVRQYAAAGTQPFTDSDDGSFAGKHSFVDASEKASLRNVFAFSVQYNKMPNTSACILVPDWPNARFNHYLKGGQLLKAYAGGTLQRYPVKLVYMPAKPANISETLAAGQQCAMCFDGSMAGYPARIAVDSQASHCFFDQSWVNRAGLAVTPASQSVLLADGKTELKVVGSCTVRMQLGALHDRVTGLVLQSLNQCHDVILGDDYLAARKCVLNYGTHSMSVRKGQRSITVKASPPAEPSSTVTDDSAPAPAAAAASSTPPMLSAVQARRAMKKASDESFVVVVRAQPGSDPMESDGEGDGDGGQHADAADASLASRVGNGPCSKRALLALLQKYRHLSPAELLSLPHGRPELPVVHTIPLLPGAQPPAPRMYRLSPRERAEVEKMVSALLKAGMIQPSSSPFGAPLLFVPKKDGTLRGVIDYRAVNRITVKDKYPIPRIDDLIDQLRGSRVYSSLDLTQGYYQLQIAEADVPKTAFKTHIGLYEYKVLPMGLSNAPATFQRAMNHVFAPFIGKFVCVYLDDILVYSRSGEEHLQHLEQVFAQMDKYKLYTKLPKCTFNATEVKFLGHVVGHNTVKPDPDKVKAVVDWGVPQDIHQLRSFLGLVNYFSKFIEHHARVAQPLTALLKKHAPFHMNPGALTAFETLKQKLVTAPVLTIADSTRPFRVVADASKQDLGGILLQGGQPVAYESRKLKPAEQNYATHEREMLAVVHCLRTWRCYLHGTEFEVHTDHKPLLLLDTQPVLSARQARWIEYLTQFNFTWHYVKGEANPADCLTRVPSAMSAAVLSAVTRSQDKRSAVGGRGARPAPSPSLPQLPAEVIPEPPGERSTESHQTTFLKQVRRAVQADAWFKNARNLRGLIKNSGLWYRDGLLVIPRDADLKRQLIAEHHGPVYSGHFGTKKTAQSLQRQFWWPRLKADVQAYVAACDTCQRNKSSTQKPAGLLQPLPIPSRKWESVGIDWITKLPCTTAGHDAIMVVVDRLSKLTHLIPTVTTAAAPDVAQLFIEQVVRLHGMPSQIVSDRDSKFTSVFWRTVCERWGVQQAMSSAYHPQTDGQTERVNRILEEYLRCYVSPMQDDWDQYLPMAEFAINDSYQASIGMTPFYMTYGCHPPLPTRLGAPTKDNPEGKHFVERVQAAVRDAKQLLSTVRQKQADQANKHRRDLQFAEGAEVLLSTANIYLRTPGTQKLLPRFIGPFKVLSKVGPVAYRLQLPPQMHRVHPVFHVSLLKPYVADGPVQPPPPLLYDGGEPIFEVEEVLEHREVKRRKGQTAKQYYIKWKGYGPENNTWEPERNLNRAALDSYWQRQKA